MYDKYDIDLDFGLYGKYNPHKDLSFASFFYSIYISLIDVAYAYKNNYKLSNHTWTTLNVAVHAWINLDQCLYKQMT